MQERLKDKYIDPFTDFGFKKLFGEECNKDLLLDFLNELLHKKEGKILSLDDIPDKLREKIFEKIFAAAEIAKLTPEEYEAYVDSLNSYRDLQNSIDTARDEGRAEGKTEEKIEIAKKMKTCGMSFDQISEITDLSIEEIEKINNL